MKRQRRLLGWPVRIAAIVAIVAIAGAAAWLRWHGMLWPAWRALSTAETYELISLEPDMRTATPSGVRYYNHGVLGSTSITDPATRRRLNDALQAGVRSSDGTVMACFNPRHGIRVTRGGVVSEFVVCFECRQVRVYRDGKTYHFLTSDSPQKVFDAVLKSANVPLAAKEP
jgi:hypothetical protein